MACAHHCRITHVCTKLSEIFIPSSAECKHKPKSMLNRKLIGPSFARFQLFSRNCSIHGKCQTISLKNVKLKKGYVWHLNVPFLLHMCVTRNLSILLTMQYNTPYYFLYNTLIVFVFWMYFIIIIILLCNNI